MHEGKRPGGLTALAVFNFIGVGVDVLGIITVLGMIVFGGKLADIAERGFRKQAEARAREEGRDPATADVEPDQQRALAVMRNYEGGSGPILQAVGLVACTGLLLAAGIGYLRQRRWGRILGNIYAIVAVATVLQQMRVVPPEYGGGLRFAALIGFLYPVVTLYLLNSTFREDLRR